MMFKRMYSNTEVDLVEYIEIMPKAPSMQLLLHCIKKVREHICYIENGKVQRNLCVQSACSQKYGMPLRRPN